MEVVRKKDEEGEDQDFDTVLKMSLPEREVTRIRKESQRSKDFIKTKTLLTFPRSETMQKVQKDLHAKWKEDEQSMFKEYIKK